MNNEILELYQEMILDHNKNPCNYGKIDDATAKSEGFNPLCGDRVTVYIKLKNDVIEDISFEGAGCAISKASASLMTNELKGKNKKEALVLFDKVHNMLTGTSADNLSEDLGKLTMLSGVVHFPLRVKCATIAWHAMQDAIKKDKK